MARPKETLQALERLIALEREEEIARDAARLSEGGVEALADAGRALVGLTGASAGSGLGGRFLVAYRPRREGERLPDTRLGSGDEVRVVDARDPGEGERGLVAARTRDAITVAFERPPPEAAYGSGLAVVRTQSDVTYRRERNAIAAVRRARLGRLADLRDRLLDDDAPPPSFEEPRPFDPLDAGLDETQREAVRHALAARDLALVHGPPGTGKTTTLVEVVRQARRRGERVLVTAATNTAVDNLVRRLAVAGEPVVRLGHPARVDPAVHAVTLDLLVEADNGYRLSRRLLDEARTLMTRRGGLERKVSLGRKRPGEAREARREMSAEIGSLLADVRKLEKQAVERVLGRASIVCATLSGSASDVLAGEVYDLVVVDEATQATVPATLVPLLRAGEASRLVLAGDHRQLPPTVLSPEAARAGLATSLFERLATRWDGEATSLLEMQYRMHEAIMGFASARFYEGRLEADASVREHLLAGLRGVEEGELTTEPLTFIDTAGRGFEETREGDESVFNEGEAALVADRVRLLIDAGTPPEHVAVVTPYAAQARLVRAGLEDIEGLEVDTVDGFQGREKEAIVVSLVRSNAGGEVGFLADTRRMNVAWTRARRCLVVIGDSATIGAHPFYAAMIEHVEKHGVYKSAWELEPG